MDSKKEDDWGPLRITSLVHNSAISVSQIPLSVPRHIFSPRINLEADVQVVKYDFC